MTLDSGMSSQQSKSVKSSRQPWLKFFLAALSAFFFLSVFFSVFTPAPLLILYFRFGRKWGAWGSLAAAFLVGALGGGLAGLLFCAVIFPVSLGMAEFLRRKQSIEKAATMALILMAVAGAGAGVVYSHFHPAQLWSKVTQEFSLGIDQMVKSIEEGGRQPWMTSEEFQSWKQGLLAEMPSAIAILALILVCANLMILLKLNPGRIREELGLELGFFRKWKAPEYLVWPTIVSGFFLLLEVRGVSLVAMNVFKFLMAVYAIQGLSVLSFFFEVWNVRRFLRGMGYLFAILLMRPLLLSLGFFDLWFDFRSKIRQS